MARSTTRMGAAPPETTGATDPGRAVSEAATMLGDLLADPRAVPEDTARTSIG